MHNLDEGRTWQTEYGDGQAAREGEILRTTVGSGLHGIAIEGTDDHDEMGIFIERPEELLGVGTLDRGVFGEYRRDYMARTAKEGERSYHGDVDLTIYSLGKYLRLALKGNPTALLPLFAPEESVLFNTELGQFLRECRTFFASQRSVHRFLGYMEAQHERMMGGGKRNRVPKRQELLDAYGWDTKYGSHALRLAYQGFELLHTGHLTLPMPRAQRDRVLDVKRGLIPQHMVSQEILSIKDQMERVLAKGAYLRPQPDVKNITRMAINMRVVHWGWSKRGFDGLET
jgi:hypothetical protein